MRGAISAAAAMSAIVVSWKPRSPNSPKAAFDDLLAGSLLLAFT